MFSRACRVGGRYNLYSRWISTSETDFRGALENALIKSKVRDQLRHRGWCIVDGAPNLIVLSTQMMEFL